jgi:hypothetical protein
MEGMRSTRSMTWPSVISPLVHTRRTREKFRVQSLPLRHKARARHQGSQRT